jgi:hypothetical protein
VAEWRGIPYVERTDMEQVAPDGSRVLRTLEFLATEEGLSWEERENIKRQFVGYAFIKQSLDGTKNYISRVTPHYMPAPAIGSPIYLYCHGFAGSENLGPSNNETTILHAAGDRTVYPLRWRAQVEYRSLGAMEVREDDEVLATAGDLVGFPDEGDCLRRGWINTRSVHKRREPGGRVIPIRSGALKYVSYVIGGVNAPTLEPLPFPETWQPTWYMWSVPIEGYPESIIQDQLNTVNHETFDGHPRGTLYASAYQEDIKRDPFGNWMAHLTFKMIFSPRKNAVGSPLGHNAALYISPSTGPRYSLLSTDGSNFESKQVFRYTDFGNFFRPKQP